MQFTLRSLMRLTTASAVLFTLAVACNAHAPSIFLLVLIVSAPLGLLGCGLIIQSGFLAISMLLTSHRDVHQQSNLRNCVRMAAGGIAATTAASYSILTFLLNF